MIAWIAPLSWIQNITRVHCMHRTPTATLNLNVLLCCFLGQVNLVRAEMVNSMFKGICAVSSLAHTSIIISAAAIHPSLQQHWWRCKVKNSKIISLELYLGEKCIRECIDQKMHWTNERPSTKRRSFTPSQGFLFLVLDIHLSVGLFGGSIQKVMQLHVLDRKDAW